MESYLTTLGTLATIGSVLIPVTTIWVSRNKARRIKLETDTYDRSGMQILSLETGNWNSSVANHIGEVRLDKEYAKKVTKIGVYTSDQKTCLYETTVDFTNGKKFQTIKL